MTREEYLKLRLKITFMVLALAFVADHVFARGPGMAYVRDLEARIALLEEHPILPRDVILQDPYGDTAAYRLMVPGARPDRTWGSDLNVKDDAQ